MIQRMLILAVMAIVAGCSGAPEPAAPGAGLSPQEARAIAKDAVIYGFPLVDHYRIQHSYFVNREHPEYKAPWNTLFNTARVYTPEDKAIQTPNSDTPYSFFGADLRAEPLVITVPEIDKSRYYSLQFIDEYTFNFAYVGSRATGGEPGTFLLAGPGWKGKTPPGVKSVLKCETEFAFVIIRTQLLGDADLENVKKVQAGYQVRPLSVALGNPESPAAPKIEFPKPLTPEEQRTSPDFFRILDFVLQFCPTHPSEVDLRARFEKLGIRGRRGFDPAALTPELRQAVQAGMADAWAAFKEFKETQIDTGKRSSADAFGTREYLQNRTLDRMTAAVLGIYGNSKEEAIYPVYFVDENTQPLRGAERYTLRFGAEGLPPVNAFWSLTLYQLPASLLYANPLNRYLINSSMLPTLKRDADGGVTIHIQHENPGADLESNWLPAPAGPFLIATRLYWPKPEALNGTWKAPPLKRIGGKAATPPAPAPVSPAPAAAAADVVPVTVDNFTRAESDLYFSGIVKESGLGKLGHRRKLARIDHQTVIRLNRDTLYSSGVFDLEAGPVTIALPEAGKRYMALQVINEDHYVPAVLYGAESAVFDRGNVGTRYVAFAIRTLVDPADPKDLEQVHALQDAIKVEQKSPGSFEVPPWDPVSQKTVRDALLVLGNTMPDFKKAFGTKEEVDPVRHLVGTALGWGGNPDKAAIYLNVTPPKNDGTTAYRLLVKDVPVDAFWSVSVYNAEGYYEPNPRDAYTLNSITAKKGDDGSIAIQFGGCDGETPNCLPIMKGWNYTVRLYRPRAEILSGQWTFPEPKQLK